MQHVVIVTPVRTELGAGITVHSYHQVQYIVEYKWVRVCVLHVFTCMHVPLRQTCLLIKLAPDTLDAVHSLDIIIIMISKE